MPGGTQHLIIVPTTAQPSHPSRPTVKTRTASGGEVTEAGGRVLGCTSLSLLLGQEPGEAMRPAEPVTMRPAEPVAVASQPAMGHASSARAELQTCRVLTWLVYLIRRPNSYSRRGETRLMTEGGGMRHNLRKLFSCLMRCRVNCRRKTKGNR